jgi:thiamine biosynthesis protein ThiI
MIYIIRYGEIGLKGLNRPYFENKLIGNIKLIVGDPTARLKKIRGRVVLETEDDVSEKLKKVFGIVSFSRAEKFRPEELNERIIELVRNKKFDTFRISANRIDKDFPRTSDQIARELGALVVEKLGKKVSLKEYDLNINVEIIDSAYVFFDKIEGLGGLPVGVEGKVIVLIESNKGADAAKLIMKRGCDIIPAAFKRQNIEDINEYLPRKKELIIIKDIKKVDEIAEREDARALVVEDSFERLKEYNTKLAVLRPLCFE